MLRLIFKIIFRTILLIVGFILIYTLTAFLLPFIKVNSDFKNDPEGIKIFVSSNGMHTDLIVPVQTEIQNLRNNFAPEIFAADSTYKYLSFGWGDKGFYLNTPSWSELKTSTALKAVFGLSGSAMHVAYLNESRLKTRNTVELMISKEQFADLLLYIESGFLKSVEMPVKIDHPGYGNHDLFFEANGRYSPFNTCNLWTNRGLKKIGVKVAVWSPFAGGIMNSLH